MVGLDLPGSPLDWMDAHDNAVAMYGDARDPDLNIAAVAAATERFGRLDAALLNVGVPGRGPIETYDLADLDRVMSINVYSAVVGLKAVVPALRAGGGGSIVVTSSISGLGGETGRWPYTVSKAAVLNLVQSMAIDLAGEGIRVNAVCPGPVHTGMTTELETNHRDRYEFLRRFIPLQRWGDAEEVAQVICFLASPLASFVNGVAIPVDGGVTASSGQSLPPELADQAERARL